MELLKRFFAWLASLGNTPTAPLNTGVVEDTRPEEVKDKDWAHEERALAKPLGPFDHKEIDVSPYPYEKQWYTSSCCPHAVGLALAIERKADLGGYTRVSYIFNYRLRSNFDDEGCFLQNVFENYRVKGAPLFTTLPTPQRETDANAIRITQAMLDEAEIFKGFSYYTVKENWNDIQVLGDIAQMGHAVPILIYATTAEWSKEYPGIDVLNLRPADAEISHCVTILPNSGFTRNGKRYVVIQDSASFGGINLRKLSESFIKARCFGAGYWDRVMAPGSGAHPTFKFNNDLSPGMSGNEVKLMQKLFIAEGLLANENSTGYFGGKTLGALHAFQDKYRDKILIPNGLQKPTDTFGPASRSVANTLCV